MRARSAGADGGIAEQMPQAAQPLQPQQQEPQQQEPQQQPPGEPPGEPQQALGPGPSMSGGWDAHDFARQLCLRSVGASGGCSARAGPAAKDEEDEEDERALEPSLRHLGPDRLREVCLALWSRARLPEEARERERRGLRDEVATELTGHGRIGQITQLESEIASYRARTARASQHL